MDNREIIKNLVAVCGALNQVDVRGKQNMMNISGSIDILEAIIAVLQKEMNDTNTNNAKETE